MDAASKAKPAQWKIGLDCLMLGDYLNQQPEPFLRGEGESK